MEGVVTPNQLREVETALLGLVGPLRADLVVPREAPDLIDGLARIARIATGGQLLLARLVDDSPAPAAAGMRNGAEWIARVTATSPSAGHEMVTASKRLEDLPLAAAAAQRGELSLSQASAVADAATVDPSAEARLVEMAQSVSVGELRRECARVKAAADPDPDATHARLHRDRRLRTFRNADGAWCLSGRGTPDTGAEINAVLDALTDDIFRDAHAAGTREPRDAYRWDALVELARRAWRDLHDPCAGEDNASPDTRTVRPPRAKHRKTGVNPRFHAVLRLDYDALVRGWVDGEEVCEISGTGPVPVSVARRLLGDALLDLVITKGHDVTTVVPLRGPSAHQKIALLWQQPECSRRGCHRPVAEWDHRDPYAGNPVTSVRGLDGYCHHDHDLKTHDGWALVPGTGKREMVPPTDPRHPGNPTFHRRQGRRRHKRRRPAPA